MDVLRTICDTVTPQPGYDGTSWAAALDASVHTVLESCIDLDPVGDATARRNSDGRSVWIEPITNQATSEHILTQEEHILTWALDAQSDNPEPSATITDVALDEGQYASASAVAGDDRLVLVVGPAGAGKTRMLQAAVSDLHAQQRPVMGLAPTAKAARVLQSETGMVADTVAKLLYELDRPDSDDSWWDAGPGMTVIVDEAGMLNTSDLSRLVTHAEQRQWRLALVGDPHQLQAVGRGGMFLELCDTGRTVELQHLHRFSNRWEAAASLELRRGNPSALDTYAAHGRIRAGTFAEHLDTIGELWQQCRSEGESLSIITTRTEHVNAINDHIQQRRLDTGELDQSTLAQVDDSWVMVGDVVATRRNERRLRTTVGEPVRNRERWTVTATDTVEEGDVTVTRLDGHGTITLPRDYVRQHMQLAYATTEPGAQGDTSQRSLTLATNATTRRGLYMAMTAVNARTSPWWSPTPTTSPKHEPCSKQSCSPTAPTSPPRCSAATWQRPSPPACRSGGSGYLTGSTRFAPRRKKVGASHSNGSANATPSAPPSENELRWPVRSCRRRRRHTRRSPSRSPLPNAS